MIKEKTMKIILFLSILLSCIVVNTKINSNPQNLNVEKELQLQSYEIDGITCEDSSVLAQKNFSSSTIISESLNNDFNILSQNLLTREINYINFDEEYYTYRQFAFDSSLSRDSANLRRNNINIEINTKSIGNSVVLYTNGYNPILQTNRTEPMRFIGDDDRELVNDTTIWPYSACGYLMTRFDVMNNITGNVESRCFIGTGFLEGPDLMVTAGHAVYGDVTSSYTDENNVLHEEYEDNLNNPRFPDEIRYYPAQNGLSFIPYGYVLVERAYIEKSYSLYQEKDWACCKLSSAIGYQTGWLGKISNFYQYNYSFESFGYPGSKNGYMYRSDANLLYYEEDTGNYRTNLDGEGGQSGSPYQVIVDNNGYVCGIHTYGFGDLYTGGIRIDHFMFGFMNSFVNGNYDTQEISPTDYGYQDSYPTSDHIKTTFISSYIGNFRFMTRRFRTGYIHNEYVVMSPIKTGIREAFIEYRFMRPVKRIDVEMSHWREPSLEWLTPYTGCLELQVFDFSLNLWKTKEDLLNDYTLPIDRANPEIFTFIFDTPIYRIRFYSSTFFPMESSSNRGRVCIGNMTLWSPKDSNFLPLSGYEKDFDEYLWSDPVESTSNCYGYALDNQIHPENGDLYFCQIPGEYAGSIVQSLSKIDLVNAIKADFLKYNNEYGLNLIFEEVGKYDICPYGTYKIALVTSPIDFHFYRQELDGYWSHKPGLTHITRYDEDNNLIYDPETANRGDYVNFYGYFAVSPWSNYYENI